MLQYLVKRLLNVIPVMIVVSIIAFGFVRALPGDPARIVAGPDAPLSDVELIRQDLGLDRPIVIQYVRFVTDALQGDFGRSIKTKRPISTEIGERFMPTLWLTVCSIAWATIVGLLIGVASAVNRNKWPDYLGMTTAISGLSLPTFWLGPMLILLFAVHLRWLPSNGYGTWKHFILPSFTLGLGVAAVMARFTRSAFIEIFREDYIRTARAKGVPGRWVVWKHTLRNALIPVLTMLGLQFGFLLGGSIVIERVFGWPGIGRLLIDSVEYRDFPAIQVLIMMLALEFIVINLIVDVLYALVNPEIRYK